jgi:3-isopropylmalate/(R)-2-methylmalate dehydratase small subunit
MNVWCYGDNVNTDQLFPGKYTYTCSTADEIKPHLLEDLDPEFAKNVQPGDLIIAGKNFGCGSSREQPVLGLKAVGIKAVIAESFARIFYRASINQGLILVECPKAVKAFSEHSKVEIVVDAGIIVVDNKEYSFPKLPLEIIAIRDAGGLLNYTREKLKNRN